MVRPEFLVARLFSLMLVAAGACSESDRDAQRVLQMATYGCASENGGGGRYSPVAALPEHYATAFELAKVAHGTIVELRNTRSMEPTLDAEDLLLMQPTRIEELAVGDVVGFMRRPDSPMWSPRRPPELVIHRVISLHPAAARTRGDNVCNPDDGLLTEKSLKGRIEFVIDGQTGAIRDLRASFAGEIVTREQALKRFGDRGATSKATGTPPRGKPSTSPAPELSKPVQ